MEIKETILQEIEEFNNSIREALAAKKINATGEASRSLRINTTESATYYKIQSIGIFYLEFLDTGRGGLPSSKPPPIRPLQRWAMVKFGVSEEEALSIAFAVREKINQVGTEIFRNNSKGIELDEKVNKLKKVLNEKIATAAKYEVLQKLDRYKNIFKQKQKMKL